MEAYGTKAYGTTLYGGGAALAWHPVTDLVPEIWEPRPHDGESWLPRVSPSEDWAVREKKHG